MKLNTRKLDIVLQSANGLKKVHKSRSAAYAVAWMDPGVRVPSPFDKNHGRNPVWNATISVTLDERTLGQQKCLNIELLGQGLVSTKPIGFVKIDMTDILLKGSQGASVHVPFLQHPVFRRSGKQRGVLNFELCLQASTMSMHRLPQEENLKPITAPSNPSEPSAWPQTYQREPGMHPQQSVMRSFSSAKALSRSSSADKDYGNKLARSTSKAPRCKQDEISLLDSFFEVDLWRILYKTIVVVQKDHRGNKYYSKLLRGHHVPFPDVKV